MKTPYGTVWKSRSWKSRSWKSRSWSHTAWGSTLWLGLLLSLWVMPAEAQFQQYTPPGNFEEERESMDDLLSRSMKEARWRFGRAFFHPWVGLRDIAFVDPALRTDSLEESDFTATIGVGVRGYVPIGPEMTLALHALPEYVWWKDLDERRRINGRYGAGLFGNLGRTGLEISLSRTDDASFVSREIEQKVNSEDLTAKVSAEVDVGAGFSLFAEGNVRQIRFAALEEDSALRGLDSLERDEDLLRAGVRVLLPRGLRLGLGVESSQVDFEQNALRSNSGTSPLLQVDFDSGRVALALNLAFRDLEPEPGSQFVPYDDVTGSFRTVWRVGGNTQLQLFGDRNLVYSTQDRWAYFEDTGIGVGVKTSLSSRLSLRVFAMDGSNDYVNFEPTAPQRVDDFEAYGGEVRIEIDRFTLTLGAAVSDYTSNFEEFDRSTTTIRSGLALGFPSGSPWG
ncbi:MAG: hypothetical protein AAF560_06550 [Acidobacteriota bacterium]